MLDSLTKVGSDELKLPISVSEVVEVYDQLFESKIMKVVRKLPRTHLLVLKSIHKCYVETNDQGKKLKGFSE